MKPEIYSDLVDVLRKSVAKHAQRNVLGTKRNDQWQWITYGEFGKRVDDFRGGLADLGIGEGDTVAIISGNRVEWAIAAYATYGLGARFCPMYESQLEEDWTYILEDSGAKVLLTSTYQIFEITRDWNQKIDRLENVFCMSLPEEDVSSFGSLERRGATNPTPTVDIDPEWVCGFIYTSGTTGRPKGVLLTHTNICSNINAVASIFPIDHSDVTVSFLPWAHSFGQTCELHCLISRGAAIAVAESVEKLVDNFGEVRPTMIYAVPRIFNRIYDGLHKQLAEAGGAKKAIFEAGLANAEKRYNLKQEGKSSALVELKHAFFDKLAFSKVRDKFGGRVKYAISGGAALSREVAYFIEYLGIVVCEGYGLTETSPIATANHPGGRKIGSVGRAIPGVEVRIDRSVVDDEDSDDGEVIVKGPNVMKGYHNLPEETDEVITEDGAFRTGDLGRLDADGFLFITGRLKEQYKLENGKYVVPAPLEEILQLSPFVTQAFIHGANRPFNVALVVPDRVAVEKWAQSNGIRGDYEEILTNDKTRGLIDGELEKHSGSFKGYERPRAFTVVAEEFTVDNGLLTPKMSVKRRKVIDRYGDLLDGLYGD
ncbi:MAG: long-chain fatty acid--CoA ligase [Thermoanaerobaculia bacterium]|nr:long-chain fatty acid--CoA ligase [Thermoanaerobaculia bacterium]